MTWHVHAGACRSSSLVNGSVKVDGRCRRTSQHGVGAVQLVSAEVACGQQVRVGLRHMMQQPICFSAFLAIRALHINKLDARGRCKALLAGSTAMAACTPTLLGNCAHRRSAKNWALLCR